MSVFGEPNYDTYTKDVYLLFIYKYDLNFQKIQFHQIFFLNTLVKRSKDKRRRKNVSLASIDINYLLQ